MLKHLFFICVPAIACILTTSSAFSEWEERLNFKFDNRHWIQVASQTDAHGWHMIFVPEGQTRERWTERFIYRYTEGPRTFSPQAYYQEYIRPFQNGKEFSSRIIDQSNDDIFFEWSVVSASSMPDALELHRFVFGKRANHTIQYTVKTSDFPLAKKEEWIRLFKAATVNSQEAIGSSTH